MTARKPAPCGTTGGYSRHRRAKEPTCEPCRQAIRVKDTAARRTRGIPPRTTIECGTRSGYRRHLRRGEETCPSCRAANVARYHVQRTDQANVEQHRHYVAARGRALSRLADLHPQQMAALLADELGEDDAVVRKPWKWKAA